MSLEFQNDANDGENAGVSSEIRQPISDTFPIYSAILIVCLIIVAAAQYIVDSNDKDFEGNKSIVLAGFLKKAFIDGQYWRSVTSGVIHSGLPHLFFNSYAVYVFGKPFEMLSNRSHLIIVFLLAVIGGDMMSLAFGSSLVSVGASGGITGLLGYLTVYAFKRREILSSDFLKGLLINIGMIAFFGLVVMRNIDNFAHLGGFLVGGIYGLFQITGDVYKDPRIVSNTMDLVGKISLGILFAICLFTILVLFEVVKVNLLDSYFK